MKVRAIILGASTTGKTTILNYLKDHTSISVRESDDVLKEMNGGIYPTDIDYKMNVLAPKMVKSVLNMGEIIFFSNTHYFQHEDLEMAHKKGFIVMQLELDREIMEKRNQHRIEHEGYDDLSIYFDSMLEYQTTSKDKKLIDVVIDTNRDVEVITEDILKRVNKAK